MLVPARGMRVRGRGLVLGFGEVTVLFLLKHLVAQMLDELLCTENRCENAPTSGSLSCMVLRDIPP